jgi:hypothetical protein
MSERHDDASSPGSPDGRPTQDHRERLQHRTLELIGRLWADPALVERLRAAPREVLGEAGLPLPPGVEVTVLEDDGDVQHLVLPPADHPRRAEIEAAVAKVREFAPAEVRIVEDDETRVHFVLPAPPAHVDVEDLDEPEVLVLAVRSALGPSWPGPAGEGDAGGE